MEKVRVRFAPSPTGFLHIGSVRTVIFNYLIAKKLNGSFILRIEDTDQKREVPGAVEGLINIIDWLGLCFNEGPHIGGEYGPYIQTQRLDIYKKYQDELLEKEGAYYCFCTEERLRDMREKQQVEKLPPRYDRTCRNLTKEEVDTKIKNGEKYVIRQKLPLNGEITVHDEIKGDIKFSCADLDDQVLIKANGIPTYQFANVVDDHEMQISHVLRGDEWISSFPKNALLYKSFDWDMPKFIHMPLTLNKEGGKLSKRQGDVAVEDYKRKGYLSEAILNFCVLQGWHPKDDNEILSIDDMAERFNIEDMGKSPSIFDSDKLDYFNGYYIRQKKLDEILDQCLKYYYEENFISLSNGKYLNKLSGDEISLDFIKKVIATEKERMKKLSEITELTKFFFLPKLEYEKSLLIWKQLSFDDIKNNLTSILKILEAINNDEWDKNIIENAVMSYLKNSNLKVGDYLWPIRVSLSGQKNSPGPFEIADALGKNITIERIKSAIDII